MSLFKETVSRSQSINHFNFAPTVGRIENSGSWHTAEKEIFAPSAIRIENLGNWHTANREFLGHAN
jgi:hypothetical protein